MIYSSVFDNIFRNVPLRMPISIIRQNIFKDCDSNFINWNRTMTIPPSSSSSSSVKQIIIEFTNAGFCRMAKTIVNMINYQKIQADFALDYRKNAPKVDMLPLKHCNDQTGECAECQSEDVQYVCSNCYTESTSVYYCSPDHQLKHWNFHRWDCRKAPDLIEIDEIESHREENQKEKINNFEPHEPDYLNVGDYVRITHIESPVSEETSFRVLH